MSGYLDAAYAASLAEWGTPRALSRSGGWVLERPIPGSPWRDAMGPYPLFACRDWTGLEADLADVSGEWVSLSLVADPFGNHNRELLERCFDRVVPFKEHLLVELDRPVEQIASKHHRYYARRALGHVEVELVDPLSFLDEWARLYAALVERHTLRGIKAFSPEAFAGQLRVPGVVALRASVAGEPAAGHLWFRQGPVAYSHLAASNALGYEHSAAYALYWTAIEHFRQEGEVRVLNIGAGAGSGAGPASGLDAFKQGWATGSVPAYFCGRIFNQERYESLVRQQTASGDYFPAYRAGEF